MLCYIVCVNPTMRLPLGLQNPKQAHQVGKAEVAVISSLLQHIRDMVSCPAET